jgi:hypothetical protein
MNHHALGFVDHKQERVFVYNVQGNVFRLYVERGYSGAGKMCLGDFQVYMVAWFQQVVGGHCLIVDPGLSAANEILDHGPAVPAQGGQRLV